MRNRSRITERSAVWLRWSTVIRGSASCASAWADANSTTAIARNILTRLAPLGTLWFPKRDYGSVGRARLLPRGGGDWMEEPGLRALVTRPREDAECLVAALATRGVEALVEPLMEIHYQVPDPLDLGGVQAILSTSANGVRALARASRERRVPLLAVGDATAARARAEGFDHVESAGGDARDLARLVAARLRPLDGPLLHVAGNRCRRSCRLVARTGVRRREACSL